MSSYLGIDGKWHGGPLPNQDDAILADILRRSLADHQVELEGNDLVVVGSYDAPLLAPLSDAEADAIRRIQE